MIRINANELKKILDMTPESQNILLAGKHGIGKSQILTNYYKKTGIKVIPLFLGQMSDPGDLIGLPYKNETTGKTEFMPPYWFPTDGTPIVLFLDELNRARPEVLQTIMDLALNKTLAGKSLPKGSRIISAVNTGDEYQLTDLDPALVSRFNVFEFMPSVPEWLLWAEKSGIDERIISFVSQNPDYLDGAALRKEDMGLEKTPDRRGWERISDIIKGKPNVSDEIYKKISAGIIGMPAATKFFAAISKNSVLSAQEILTQDFKDVEDTLKKYSTPTLAIVNESLFRYIESKNYDKSKTAEIARNLDKYFGMLILEMKQEAMGHFANLFTSEPYQSVAAFIMMNIPSLQAKIMKFIQSI
ncbi:AAA family ATPase [Treponema saccharophilum]|uniref:AAA family ATPase n=1 Tax=Treponema saccharophilum TaxID=165 RepID=UPI003863DBC3